MLGKSYGLKQSITRKFRDYCNSTSGNIATFFAFSVPFALIAIGSALDTARITREYSTFHASVDSAAFAIAQDSRSASTGGTISETNKLALIELGKKYISSNYSADKSFKGQVNLDLTVTGKQINVSAELEFPTTLMKLVGIDTVTMNASTTVEKAMRPVEIVLVMDTTGSMQGTKMTGLKQGITDFLQKMYKTNNSSEYIRMALVPFAAAVRLDNSPTAADFNLNWIDTTGINPLSKLNFTDPTWNNYMAWGQVKKNNTTYHTWNGCVEARKWGVTSASSTADLHINDVAPVQSNGETLFPAYFAPDVYTDKTSGTTTGSRDGDYIGNSTTTTVKNTSPTLNVGVKEWQGFATSPNSSTAAEQTARQENQAKYVNAVVGTENTNKENDNKVYGPWYNCAATPIVPMTYDRSKIQAAADNMQAYGNTMIAEGMAWGLRVISPTEPFTKVQLAPGIPNDAKNKEIAKFKKDGETKWKKVMVLMSDGDNMVAGAFNDNITAINGTAYGSYGFGKEAIANNRYNTTSAWTTNVNTATNNICSKIKALDIPVYVAAYGDTISATGVTTLENCATDKIAPYYMRATTPAELATFFDHVGEDVLNKMIYASK
jgi:Flp pilus assembly protein TadG